MALLIVAPYVLGHAQLSLWDKLGILAATLVLAGLTKRWVEDPVRLSPLLASRKPRWTYLVAVIAMLVVVVPSLAGGAIVHADVARDDALRVKLAASQCFGAASMDPSKYCASTSFPAISPDPALAPQDSPDIYFTNPPCFATAEQVVSCGFGDPSSTIRVALVGDSHAAQWAPALKRLAEQRGWDLRLYLKTNCAFTDAQRSAQYASCDKWSRNVSKKLAAEKPFSLIVTSFFAESLNAEVDHDAVSIAAADRGFHDVWKPLTDRGSTVVVLKDTPFMLPSTTVCVATSGASATCDVKRSTATAAPDLQYLAAIRVSGVLRVDLTRLFCGPAKCAAVIGGVAVRTDPYHMTKTYSETTAPYLYAALAHTITTGEVPPTL